MPIVRWKSDELTVPMAGFVDAVVDAGHPYCEDMNHPEASGVGPYPQNRSDRRRRATAITHLAAARSRSNLVVRGGAQVDRVLFEAGRAVGVEVDGELVRGREITLCAGTPGTPALLLRSGVGPADELAEAGVAVSVDLPGVGRGVYDQPGAVLPAVPTEHAVPDEWPPTQVIGRLAAIPGHPVDQSFYLNLFSGPPPGGGPVLNTIMIGDMNCRSRGAVTLAADSSPVLDLGFYQVAEDLDRMRSAYRHAWDIAHRAAFAAVTDGFAMVAEDDIAEDERLDALLRQMTFSRLTLCGGAAMGSVVDEHARVRGVDGLRVVDLSIAPVPLRSTTALEAMVIAEHAADWVAAAA